jgi:pimeloyl-ACP methyl ester carboxylesterase
MAMLFAATYPERTRGLLLFGTVADFTRGRDAENEPIELDRIERLWGTDEYARLALRECAARASLTTNGWSPGSPHTRVGPRVRVLRSHWHA